MLKCHAAPAEDLAFGIDRHDGLTVLRETHFRRRHGQHDFGFFLTDLSRGIPRQDFPSITATDQCFMIRCQRQLPNHVGVSVQHFDLPWPTPIGQIPNSNGLIRTRGCQRFRHPSLFPCPPSPPAQGRSHPRGSSTELAEKLCHVAGHEATRRGETSMASGKPRPIDRVGPRQLVRIEGQAQSGTGRARKGSLQVPNSC